MINDSTQYIARISYGKDSLKMLDVIKSRGLPLDRITTTDVWATDTIPANLPEMLEFKDRMDQIIWSMYHIEVEHLCAFNKDGTKRTYEQMFYHIPDRRSQIGQVERERETEARAGIDQRISGTRNTVVPASQDLFQITDSRDRSRDSQEQPVSTGVKNSKFVGCAIKGFPLSRKGNGVKWCQDLKTVRVFYGAPDEAQKKKYRRISGHCCR